MNNTLEIRYCNRCGSTVVKSDIKDYPYLCMECDENLYSFETYSEDEVNE